MPVYFYIIWGCIWSEGNEVPRVLMSGCSYLCSSVQAVIWSSVGVCVHVHCTINLLSFLSQELVNKCLLWVFSICWFWAVAFCQALKKKNETFLGEVLLISSCQHFHDNPCTPAFKIKGVNLVLWLSLIPPLLHVIVEIMQCGLCSLSHSEMGFLWV